MSISISRIAYSAYVLKNISPKNCYIIHGLSLYLTLTRGYCETFLFFWSLGFSLLVNLH